MREIESKVDFKAENNTIKHKLNPI